VPDLPRLRTPSAEKWRSSLWVWPSAASGVGFVAGILLTRIRPEEGTRPSMLWYGDVDSATTLLQSTATSVMTATTITFTLTVVALQLASQQFSPRLLREFSRDAVTKRVLVVLSGTFVFTTTALYGIRADEPVPDVAVGVGLILGIASLGAILAFITHMVRALRVDTMMASVHDETGGAIATFYPEHGDDSQVVPDELELDPVRGVIVPATRGGFVVMVDVRRLVRCARQHDVLVRIEVRPGDHVQRGAPLAIVWEPGGAARTEVGDELADAVRGPITFGYERTLDQDTGFGFRQLEDIAVKAMSPSVNDPVTAAHAVGHMGDLMVRLTGCRLGPSLHRDEDGVGRAIVPDRDFDYYLDLACGQLRRFGASEPSVLIALLRMLRDVAVSARDDDHRAGVQRHAALVAGQLSDAVVDDDARAVRDMHDRVELALAGDVLAAYADRAGETRSI
jgi:uncharacterized membrane protein